jgi:oligopeptide/dipeptide ABC transporter ATP-binding protein
MDSFIKIADLEKIFYGNRIFRRKKNAVLAVDRVSFAIDKNTVFGLVGESGCGKTSLVRALLYLDPPTAGEVWIDGSRLGDMTKAEMRSFRQRMQIVFQDPNSALNPKMRIQDSLEEGMINRGMPTEDRQKRVVQLLDLVGISPSHRQRYPHEFSGGQKQRIVIARALSMDPDFLVLDEPVSNLDVSIQAQIINLLQDLKEELLLTYLFISHDLNLVAYLSDHIAVMYRGRVVEMGSTDEIMGHPMHPYTRILFSSIPGIMDVKELKNDVRTAGSVERTKEIQYVMEKGCHYVDQCPLGDDTCRSVEPSLATVQGGHKAACHKAGEGST